MNQMVQWLVQGPPSLCCLGGTCESLLVCKYPKATGSLGPVTLRSHSLFLPLYETNVVLCVCQTFTRQKHWGTLMTPLPLTSDKDQVRGIAQVMEIICPPTWPVREPPALGLPLGV